MWQSAFSLLKQTKLFSLFSGSKNTSLHLLTVYHEPHESQQSWTRLINHVTCKHLCESAGPLIYNKIKYLICRVSLLKSALFSEQEWGLSAGCLDFIQQTVGSSLQVSEPPQPYLQSWSPHKPETKSATNTFLLFIHHFLERTMWYHTAVIANLIKWKFYNCL